MIRYEVNGDIALLDEAVSSGVEPYFRRLCTLNRVPVNSEEDALLRSCRIERATRRRELQPRDIRRCRELEGCWTAEADIDVTTIEGRKAVESEERCRACIAPSAVILRIAGPMPWTVSSAVIGTAAATHQEPFAFSMRTRMGPMMFSLRVDTCDKKGILKARSAGVLHSPAQIDVRVLGGLLPVVVA